MAKRNSDLMKPYSQKTTAEKIAEHKRAIERLEETLNAGQNRFGSYGDNVRESLKRQRASLAALTA